MPAHPRDRRGVISSSAVVDTTAAGATTSSDSTYCRTCDGHFRSYEHYICHLINSGNHFTCDICHVDYHSAEALNRHNKQMHAHEQEVNCPGCHKVFNRAGGLMSHIEYKECIILKPGLIEELRAHNPRNSGRFDAIRAAPAWGAVEFNANPQFRRGGSSDTFSRNVSGPSVGPFGHAMTVEPVDPLLKNLVREQAAVEHAFGEKSTEQAIEEEEDLIAFNAPSLVLNASWDQPIVSFNSADFPALPAPVIPVPKNTSIATGNVVNHSTSSLATLGHTAKGQGRADDISQDVSGSALNAVPIWDTAFNKTPASTMLFPGAPSATAPPAALVQNLTISPPSAEPLYAEHDPHDPSFDPSRYYNKFAQGYKCPHRGCKKNLASITAFIQHLKSPIHMDLEKVNCPHCLRPFPSATALTQHIESQAIRCSARKLDYVDSLVEDITQVVTADGLHPDETVKYVNIPGVLTGSQAAAAVIGGAQRVVEASRRAVEAQVEAKKENAKKLYQNQKW